MSKVVLYIVFLLFIASSCGTKKNSENLSVQISKKDYPYISKFHEGVRLKTKGRVEEAIAKFEECLLIKQDDDAVYYALSKLEFAKGNLENSSKYVVEAHELDPENTWYIQDLAYMYFETENFKESVVNFAKLVEIEPRNIDWQYGYAEALVRSEKLEMAIEVLNKMEGQVGLNSQLSIQKYQLYMDVKKADKAIAEIDKAREVFPNNIQLIATLVDHYYKTSQQQKAISMLEKLVIADPDNGRAHLALADVYLSKNEKQKAYSQLELAFHSSDVDLDTKMKILITILESSQNIDPKINRLVDELIQMHSTESKAHSIRGDYLIRAEKEDEALLAYKEALKYDNSKFPIWKQVLIMEYQAEKFADLYEDSKECLTLFPSVAIVYLLNGASSNHLKLYDESIEKLSVGVELLINDKPLEAEFYGQIAEAYFGLNDIENGKKQYEIAISLDPGSSLLKNNFAYQLAKSQVNLEEAISLATQAVQSSPNEVLFVDTYGFVFFQMEEYAKAKEQFENAFDMNESDIGVIEHLGDVEFKLSNVYQALDWWKKAQELGQKSTLLIRKIRDKKFYAE
tara:strand:+ start:25322 stop:27031 length:1710 start_codon:yes stop_codon:yes gene_type:complete